MNTKKFIELDNKDTIDLSSMNLSYHEDNLNKLAITLANLKSINTEITNMSTIVDKNIPDTRKISTLYKLRFLLRRDLNLIDITC